MSMPPRPTISENFNPTITREPRGTRFSLSDGQFSQLHSDLGSQGGFTVHPGTGEPRTEGIAVATEQNEKRLAASESSPGAIKSYHGKVDNQKRFDRGASLGGWRDPKSGDDFIDTPTVYSDKPGDQSRARNHMLKSNQIAAYNIGTGDTLLNPFHPENKSLDIVSSDDSPAQKEMWRQMPRNLSRGSKTELSGQSFS